VTRPPTLELAAALDRPKDRYCCCTPLSWPLLRHRHGDDDGFR
jgi:hypothetical protein